MQAKPGTYALILRSADAIDAPIGRWGRLRTQPGYFVYVGSAFGAGGVRARVSRHLRGAQRRHWHIDYLRALTEPVAVWVSYEPRVREHGWADILRTAPELTPVRRFGCSDCGCYAHLFTGAEAPRFDGFAAAAGGELEPLDGAGRPLEARRRGS